MSKDNIVVLGVGHSGTSIVTEMLFRLGWQRNDADEQYAEIPQIRSINDFILSHLYLPSEAVSLLRSLKEPWAIKDPRFVVTLPYWMSLIDYSRTTLLCLHRDLEKVKESYRVRNEMHYDQPGGHGRTVDELVSGMKYVASIWTGHKMTLHYENIADAASVFRAHGERAQEGGLWR